MVIVRGQRATLFPTRLTLVAATNPCPCGYAGEPRCRCGEAEHARHRRRLSGPLLDRIDLLASVPRPSAAALAGEGSRRTADARERVLAARGRQAARLAAEGLRVNAEMGPASVRRHVRLDAAGADRLAEAYASGTLSARGRHRALRVARTIADLDGRVRVTTEDLLMALELRERRAAAARAA